MTLSALIRKRDTGSLATAIPAIPAIPATRKGDGGGTVARIATVAVANPKGEKTAPPANAGAGDTLEGLRPKAAADAGLKLKPTHSPAAPLTADEETAIRAWLALIEETDPATIAEVIGRCQRDADARDYFTGRAAVELPKPDPFPDDRRTCGQCLNLRGRVCSIAKPERGALVVANRGYRPQADTLHRCAGYLPGPEDTDRRHGRERWPGLTDTKGSE